MKVSLSLEDIQDLKKKFRECKKTPKLISGRWVIDVSDGYDPELCLFKKAWMEEKDVNRLRIMPQHCVEFDYTVYAPYCKYCRDFLPQQFACNKMLDHLQKYGDDFYNLDVSTPMGKLLKPHIDQKMLESKGEVDSYFYSIIPKDRLDMDPLTLNAMAKYCKEIFEDKDRIAWSKWVVESGKHEDKPNPHIHAVVKFRGKPKNFARRMCTVWRKIFPDENHCIDFKRYNKKLKRDVKGIDMYRCMRPDVTSDKIKYLDNNCKHDFGEDHTNFIDLGIKGTLSS